MTIGTATYDVWVHFERKLRGFSLCLCGITNMMFRFISTYAFIFHLTILLVTVFVLKSLDGTLFCACIVTCIVSRWNTTSALGSYPSDLGNECTIVL